MKIILLSAYVLIMFFFLLCGLPIVFGAMLLLLAGMAAYMPIHKKNTIKVIKKKVLEAQKLKNEGVEVTPFIEINSSPWYVLSQLPGVSIEMAKYAVIQRRKNGPFPSINVFIQITGVKRVFVEHLKAFAYVKKEAEPIKVDKKGL